MGRGLQLPRLTGATPRGARSAEQADLLALERTRQRHSRSGTVRPFLWGRSEGLSSLEQIKRVDDKSATEEIMLSGS